MRIRTPLPDGWKEELYDRADLEASFQSLGDSQHFFVEAMRGQIRSLQLRFDEAWAHLNRATAKASRARENIPNLVCRFLLETVRFETALLEHPVDPGAEYQRLPLLDLFVNIFEKFPEVRHVVDQRRNCEGRLLLHLGRCQEAAKVFSRLISESHRAPPEVLSCYYYSLAASQQGLGLLEPAVRSLENAGFATAMVSSSLSAARCAATLYAMYSHIGMPDEAAGWLEFLQRLRCPQETRLVFVERARLLESRCTFHSRLVAF